MEKLSLVLILIFSSLIFMVGYDRVESKTVKRSHTYNPTKKTEKYNGYPIVDKQYPSQYNRRDLSYLALASTVGEESLSAGKALSSETSAKPKNKKNYDMVVKPSPYADNLHSLQYAIDTPKQEQEKMYNKKTQPNTTFAMPSNDYPPNGYAQLLRKLNQEMQGTETSGDRGITIYPHTLLNKPNKKVIYPPLDSRYTLSGNDKNNDGMRDEVEKYLNNSYYDFTEKQKWALKNIAYIHQTILSPYFDNQNEEHTTVLRVRYIVAQNCLYKYFNTKNVPNIDKDVYISSIEDIIYPNGEQKKLYKNKRHFLSSITAIIDTRKCDEQYLNTIYHNKKPFINIIK